MHIAIDAEPANRVQRTGVENVALTLLEKFIAIDGSNSNHTYTLFTKDDLRPGFPELPANFRHRKLSWPSKYFWSYLRLPFAMQLPRPDIVFIPGHEVSPFITVPAVTVVHDVAFMDNPSVYSWKSLLWHRLTLLGTVKKAKIIITPAYSVTKALCKHFPRLTVPVITVPWGVDPLFSTNSSDNDERILEEHNLEPGKYFVSVGRLERKKNTHKLVAAFQHYKNKHPEIKLVLVGKVGETGQGLNVTGAQVLGYQPTEVVAALLRNALAFVFPSVEEGFGLPIIEAQASGCPVVASNIRVFQEVAREAFLPIEPDNQLDFSHHLSVITNNKDLRTALIEKGLYNAGRYSWDAAAKKVLEIITRR